MRVAGVLMPVASLPSDFGVGDFGKYSYEFVDLLERSGIKLWQILPLNPLGYGNSPYQPYSSFAGDELYIDLYDLQNRELLSEVKTYNKSHNHVDYEKVRAYKEIFLRKAYQAYVPTKEYEEFILMDWVYDYSVFISLKKQNNLRCWNVWPKEQQDWILDKKYNLDHLRDEIQYEMFLQFIFYTQWMELKNYANQKGIEIVGDIPFYVGIDSLDVWSDRKSFLLDEEGNPTFIAGVPPDYFSETGQRWGNPIYNWEYLEENDFDFWSNRLEYCSKMFDIIRIDHFRAFDTYWKVPASCETAIEGEWIEAPGYKLFDIVLKKLKGIHIVAEDLGELRPQVLELRDYYNFKGMNIVEFSFGEEDVTLGKTNEIMYTGTHDNQTLRGWYQVQPYYAKKKIRRHLAELRYVTGPISWKMIEYAMHSPADYTIIPIQDFINLDDKGRINTPGTLGTPNWEWKLKDFSSFEKKVDAINELIIKSGRAEATSRVN